MAVVPFEAVNRMVYHIDQPMYVADIITVKAYLASLTRYLCAVDFSLRGDTKYTTYIMHPELILSCAFLRA